MNKNKRVHFLIDPLLWLEFKKLYPYKGQPTAFFNECVRAVVEKKRRLSREELTVEMESHDDKA